MEGKWQADKLKLELTAEGEGGAYDDDYADDHHDDVDNDEDIADGAEKVFLKEKLICRRNVLSHVFCKLTDFP